MENKNKKSNLKIYIIFALMIFVSCFVGYLCGGLMAKLSKKDAFDALKPVLEGVAVAFPWISFGINVVAFLISAVVFNSAKSKYARLKEDEEDKIYEIEKTINIPMVISAISMACNFFFFSAMIQIIESSKYGKAHSKFLYVFLLAVFVASMVWETFIQAKTVNFEKKLNPEKNGNIFDINFKSDWEKSCDEAEKAQIYKAAYSGYKVGTTCCMLMWIISIFGQLFFNTGLLPCITLTVIWLGMLIGFFVEASK